MNEDLTNLLTVREVAERLRISRSVIYQMVEAGKIACLKIGTGRGTIRFRLSDIEEYLNACRSERRETVRRPQPSRVRLRHIRI